ncbi:hypothetical protein [Limosilactobacillus sp.]|uniref:hypothetical protein n=1 Tax=Limosilactobacillus sp. TaxID=2773925 RepID=UPI003EFDD885
MRGQRAFTSVEMIVVLGLVVTIYLVLAPTFQPSRQAIAEQQFWHELRQDWRAAQVGAQVHHQSTVIDYYSDTKQLVFQRNGHRTLLNIPPTIALDEEKFNAFIIDDTGYTAPQTIGFKSRLQHCKYLMKVQLAWGGYRLEKVPD